MDITVNWQPSTSTYVQTINVDGGKPISTIISKPNTHGETFTGMVCNGIILLKTLFIYIYIYIYTHTHIYIYICVCVCGSVFLYACMHVCCMYVF